MKIQKTLKIEVTQADVEQAIINLIADEDPTIVVDEIQFTPKRSGKDAIAVKIDAHFGDEQPEPAIEIEVESIFEPEVVAESVEKEDEAPFDVQEEPALAKKSLFG